MQHESPEFISLIAFQRHSAAFHTLINTYKDINQSINNFIASTAATEHQGLTNKAS